MKIIESFVYIAENRRTNRPAIEQLFSFDERELSALELAAASLAQELTATLAKVGVNPATGESLELERSATPRQLFCWLYAKT
ncbi:MAG: hypothetical protein OEV47_15740, partial [Gammaproteobacteria bacterium]|nr:hypothetical protein [Gammaproteobacteria bacterium]